MNIRKTIAVLLFFLVVGIVLLLTTNSDRPRNRARETFQDLPEEMIPPPPPSHPNLVPQTNIWIRYEHRATTSFEFPITVRVIYDTDTPPPWYVRSTE